MEKSEQQRRLVFDNCDIDEKRCCPIIGESWNNGNRDPRWGVAEIQKMSPPTTVGDAADMQLCVIKQGSPPVLENVAFFVTDLLTLARCAVCILNISVGME